MAKAPRPAEAFVHPSAVVDAGATLGPGCKVWHFCHVMPGARIGARSVLGQNVYVAATAIVGDDCRVQNNVSLYDGVILHDGVFIGPSAVFTNVVNPRAGISRKQQYRKTEVEHGATVGANSTIVCGNHIGAHALVGAGAVITHDVPAFALMAGIPARRIGWVCRCGVTLPRAQKACLTCPDCNATYRLIGKDGKQTLLAIETAT